MPFVIKFFKVLALICLTSKMIGAWRAYEVIIGAINITSNNELLNVEMAVINGTNGEQTINAHIDVKQEINNVFMLFNISAANTGQRASTLKVLEKSVDLCKLMKQHSIGSKEIIRLLVEDFKKQATFVQECPIKPQIYKLDKFRFNEDHLPEFLPDAQFTFYFELREEKLGKPILLGTVNGEIDSSKGMHALREFSLGF